MTFGYTPGHLRHPGPPATPWSTGDTPGHRRHPWPPATPLATGDTPGHRRHPWPPATTLATGYTPGHRRHRLHWPNPWPSATPPSHWLHPWLHLSHLELSVLLLLLLVVGFPLQHRQPEGMEVSVSRRRVLNVLWRTRLSCCPMIWLFVHTLPPSPISKSSLFFSLPV